MSAFGESLRAALRRNLEDVKRHDARAWALFNATGGTEIEKHVRYCQAVASMERAEAARQRAFRNEAVALEHDSEAMLWEERADSWAPVAA
jgi:hypothetical protein